MKCYHGTTMLKGWFVIGILHCLILSEQGFLGFAFFLNPVIPQILKIPVHTKKPVHKFIHLQHEQAMAKNYQR
jgi:hypothetical protein